MALLLLAVSELAASGASGCPDSRAAATCASSLFGGECGTGACEQTLNACEGMHASSDGDSTTEHACLDSKKAPALRCKSKGLCALSKELQQEIRSFAYHNTSPFKFALLFSGHRGACPEAQQIIQAAAPLATPSMHVYGAPGQDQQVPHEASAELPGLFNNAKVVVHSKGHVAPSSKTDCQMYLEFAAAAIQ